VNAEVSAPTHARKVVVALTLALVAVAYLDRVCISTAAPAIRAELGLDQEQMGIVFSAFTFAYALFEMPSGWLADKFGARRALMRIVVFWSAMTAGTGLAAGYASLVALRILFGMGEAGAFPATARAYARWLPPIERGRAFGLAIMTGALAGALTQPLVVRLQPLVGWRASFAIFGSVGVVWSILWWTYFRDDPRAHRSVNDAELAVIGAAGDPPPHGAVPFRALVKNRTIVALSFVYIGTIYGWYFYLTWLPTYLLEARGFDTKTMGWFSAAPLLGIALGVFLGGVLSDVLPSRLGKRNGRRVGGLVGLPLAAVTVTVAIATPHPVASALFLALAAMLAALGVAPAWTICVDIGGPHAGVVSGAMNMCGNLAGAVGSYVVGFFVQRLHSYDAPMYSMAAMYLVAATGWLFVDPSRTLSEALAAQRPGRAAGAPST